jgi:cystathionine beta-lyase family protein involved in aluminum resistance
MLEVGDVHGFGADVGAEVVENVFEAVFEAEKFGLRENRLAKDVITFAVVVFDVLRRDAVVRQGLRGGVHRGLGS